MLLKRIWFAPVFSLAAQGQCVPELVATGRTGGSNATIVALTVNPNGNSSTPFVVIGSMTRVASTSVSNAAVLDHESWRAFGSGLPKVRATFSDRGALLSVDLGSPANLYRYDADTDHWNLFAQLPPKQLGDQVYPAVGPDGTIISHGRGTNGRLTIMRWNGSGWDQMGSTLTTTAPRKLFFVGNTPCVFVSSSGWDSARADYGSVVYWNGQDWVPTEQRVSSRALDACAFNGHLITLDSADAGSPYFIDQGEPLNHRSVIANSVTYSATPKLYDTGRHLALSHVTSINGAALSGIGLYNSSIGWAVVPATVNGYAVSSVTEGYGRVVAIQGTEYDPNIVEFVDGSWHTLTPGIEDSFSGPIRVDGADLVLNTFVDEQSQIHKLLTSPRGGDWQPYAMQLPGQPGRLWSVGDRSFASASSPGQPATLYELTNGAWIPLAVLPSQLLGVMALDHGRPAFIQNRSVIEYDGIQWITLGSAPDVAPTKIMTIGDSLYRIGGYNLYDYPNPMFVWDGATWQTVGPTISFNARDAVVDHGAIVICGHGVLTPSVTAGILKLTDAGWVNLAAGTPLEGIEITKLVSNAFGLLAYDGKDMWRFDGQTWARWLFNVTAPFDLGDEIAFIDSAGTLRRLQACGCLGDYDGDGVLTGADLDAFAKAFDTGTPGFGQTLDLDQDGFVDVFDFVEFVTRFEQGC